MNRIRTSILAAALAFGVGAISQLPAVKVAIAQGFDFVARDGNSNGPSVRGQSSISTGLYFNAKGVGFTRHLMGGAAVTANLPVLTSCGTSPAISGNDASGVVTMGTSATGCVITFGTAYTAAPTCLVVWQGTPLAAQNYTVSASAITTVQTSTSNNKISYFCIGNADG